MARKSGSRQLKRERAPAFWPIHRKEATWTTRTRPGPHPREKSLPLVIVVREILGYAKTAKEAIRIMKAAKVRVDGLVRRDHRFPVGLMDIIQVREIEQAFRVLPKPGRGLVLSPVREAETVHKLCRIIGKKTINKNTLQFSLHDGRNLLVQGIDTGKKAEEEFRVGGALQLALPGQKVVRYVPFKVGVIGLVTDGRNQGFYGKVSAISEGSYGRTRIVKIETVQEAFETPANYVIPVGTEAPLVALDS